MSGQPKKTNASKHGDGETGEMRVQPPRRTQASKPPPARERKPRKIHERRPPPRLREGNDTADECPSDPIDLADEEPREPDPDDATEPDA